MPGWINLKKDLDKLAKFYILNFYIFNGLDITGLGLVIKLLDWFNYVYVYFLNNYAYIFT